MWRSIFVLTLATAGVYAQEVAHTGTLTGIVTDSMGAVISGTKVRVVNRETQVASTVLTNETGRYFIPYLNPGNYELRVEAAGFKAYVRTGIMLQAGESPRIDMQLEVGSVNESVMVSGAAPLIDTETSTVSASLGHEQFMERLFLLQNRSFNVLMYLPGVTNIGEATFNMLGQRSRSIGNEVDGVSAKMPVQGTPVGDYQALLVPADALEEARVLTTGVPAEFGSAGSGMVVQVMKSGTRVCQAFCVNGRSFPCAAGILGGGKVGILVLDFHFSTAHSFSSFLIFLAYKQQQTTGVFRRLCEMRACRRTSPACPDSSLANLLQPSFLPATLTRLAEPGRPAESQNAATPPSSSALAWSTSWQYAPAPGTATSALHPQSETTLVS